MQYLRINNDTNNTTLTKVTS